MTFLNGIFLFALPLAAVPVVLHFYRRQRDVVAWGAMQFLVDAAKQGRQRERLEEILLMLLRCAVVLALVLALARPQLHSEWLGDQATREVILVIDNSLSMSREIAEQSVFSDLQVRASEMIDELSNNDVVQVMLAVGGPEWLTSEGVIADEQTKTILRNQIDDLQPSLGSADLFLSVQAAVDAESVAEARARHIVVLTDGQAHGWQLGEAKYWQQLQTAISGNDVPTSVRVVSCGGTEERVVNLAVRSMESSHTQVGLRQSVSVQAHVQNYGETASSALIIEQLVDGEVSGTSEVPALASGATASVSWDWSSGDPGVYALSCRITASDQLTADDDSSVIVEVVDRIPILIVEAPPDYRERISDADLFTTALGYDGETPRSDWHAVLAPTVIPSEELESKSLTGFQAVVVTSLTPLVSDTIDKLSRFVERGGGLWVVLGRRTDRKAFNSVWYDGGGGLSPLPLAELITHDGKESEEELIHPPAPDHPTTVHLSDTIRLDIDSVRIQSRQSFDRQTAGEQLSVLLETGDGEPLAIEQYVGRGRVIIQGLPFGIGWSNLPLTKAYVVMVHSWLEYLTHPAATQFNLATGARIELPQSSAGQSVEASIMTPDGREQQLTLREADEAARYRFSQTHYPGRYEVRFLDDENNPGHIPFQVARDAVESDLTPLTSDEQESLAQLSGLSFVSDTANLIPEVTSGGSNRPIWNTLLIGLLALLAVELLLATLAARARAPETSLPSLDNIGAATLEGTATGSSIEMARTTS